MTSHLWMSVFWPVSGKEICSHTHRKSTYWFWLFTHNERNVAEIQAEANTVCFKTLIAGKGKNTTKNCADEKHGNLIVYRKAV